MDMRTSTLFARVCVDIRLAREARTDAEAGEHLERAFARMEHLDDPGERRIAWDDAMSLVMRMGVRRVA